MSKPKKKTIKIAPPTDKAEAAKLLARLGDLRSKSDAFVADGQSAVQKIAAEVAESCAPLAVEGAAIAKALRKWADNNRASLLEGDSKTIKLLTGEIAWRDGPEAVALDDGWTEERVMDQLDAKDFPDCIRATYALNKEQIKTLWPHLVEKGIRGLTLVQREFFRLHPLQLAEPIEAKKSVVNVVDRLDGSKKEKAA